MQELYLNAHKESQEALASGNESGNEDKTKVYLSDALLLVFNCDY
jgi:hypothetical protein